MKTDGRQEGKDAYSRGEYKTALERWEPLAKQGDAKCQYNLGLMYFNGKGVDQDYSEALKWYRLSGEQGIVQAQLKLGEMCLQGEGVNKDIVQAHKWFNIAGASGDEDGRKNCGILEKSMTHAQIAEGRRLLEEWLAEHEQTGNIIGGTYWTDEEIDELNAFRIARKVEINNTLNIPHVSSDQIPIQPPKPDRNYLSDDALDRAVSGGAWGGGKGGRGGMKKGRGR
jgi:uncharacterized protein